MKKTRTLVLALALASFTPVFADVKYDALRPQEIITVAEGRTISNSAASFTVDLAQEQIGKKTNNRTAIAKDGQGILVLDQDVDMFCSLVVREGTLLIKDTAVTDHPYVESPVLTVGGFSRVAPLSGDSTNAHICGSYLSMEGDALFRDKSAAEGGFSNPCVDSAGRPQTPQVIY